MKKAMIKAIRLVNGWTPDLRIKCDTIYKPSLYDWIEENRIGIFGFSMAIIPDPVTEDYIKYERRIWKAVDAVISGRGED